MYLKAAINERNSLSIDIGHIDRIIVFLLFFLFIIFLFIVYFSTSTYVEVSTLVMLSCSSCASSLL